MIRTADTVLEPAHDDEPTAPRPPLRVRPAGLTDTGRVRPRNEDQFLIADFGHSLQTVQTSVRQPGLQLSHAKGHLFVVADGVGGSAAGAKASEVAVRTVENCVVNDMHSCPRSDEDAELVLAGLREALSRADRQLFEEAMRRPELSGMGTTLTVAAVRDDDLYLAHAGDSRCYLLRRNILHRLTRDHTMTEAMVRQGILKPEDAVRHSMRHVLVNVVGGTEVGVEAEAEHFIVDSGDTLLLCSDGLTEMVPEEEIREILRRETDPMQCCRRLVDRANELGGRDNVTVVVVHFE